MGRLTRALGQQLGYNAPAKAEFRLSAMAALLRLRKELGYTADGCSVRFNAGGIAVSGEATLHSNSLYVQVSQSNIGGCDAVLFRTCSSQTDYAGGANHWASAEALEDTEGFAERLRALLRNTPRPARTLNTTDDPLENRDA